MIVTEPRRRRLPSRALAVLAAILMIGASVAVRELVIDGDDEGGGTPSTGGDLRIACIEELRAACEALAAGDDDLEVVVEPAGATADPASAETPFDAWVTYAPWAGVVIDTRDRAGLDPLFDDELPEPLARSPLVFVARTDRAETLTAECGGEVTWPCVGDVAGLPWSDIGGSEAWGRIRPAHANPLTNADGLLALGHAVGTFAATDEIPPDSVTRIDWDTDEFASWFPRLERAIPADAFTRGDPFQRFLRGRLTATYDVVATTEAAALTALAAAAPDVRQAATVLYPAPVATADVVLVPVTGADLADLDEDVRTALAESGFRVGDEIPTGAPGAPALPETDGLPSPGSLVALQDRWKRVQ